MRYALIGGVASTVVALDHLLLNGANVVGVLGYVPKRAENVSGYVDVVNYARRAGVENVVPFSKVNESSTIDVLKDWKVDVLLVVGLSQLVSKSVRETARSLAVGFHPTQLPRGRGRAPIAWLVLSQEDGAATLFELADDADAGDILAQVPYPVRTGDHAADVLDRCLLALGEAISHFVRSNQRGSLTRTPQVAEDATYWGVRRPEDGRIDWTLPAANVDALVRASSAPHPGAYTVTPGGEKITFMRSLGLESSHSGVPGRLLEMRGDSWVVACGDVAVRLGDVIRDRSDEESPRVGDLISWNLASVDRLLRD